MNNFIIYSIEIGICLALFYLAYWVFLKKETFFKLNRFYLMASIIISLLVPLLNISISDPGESSFITKYLILPIDQYENNISVNLDDKFVHRRHGMMFPGDAEFAEGDMTPNVDKMGESKSNLAKITPVNSSEKNNSDTKINWLNVIFLIYFIGAALFLIRFMTNLVWILTYVLRNRPQQISGLKVIKLEKNISPFSFLNRVFISNKNDYPEAELNKIISHEKIHIQQKHSIDLILFELLLVFQWFNPFVWLYKRAIKITHEYLADHGTINSGVDMPSYQYSLLNQVLRENNFEIASNYNLSIKKRITMMMKKRSSKLAALKLIIALPIFIFLFSAFAFNSSKKEVVNKVANNKTVNGDTTIKRVNVPLEYLKLLEGEYVATNEPGSNRRIIFTEVMGNLYGLDDTYTYRIVPVGDGKFINPDDYASLVFDTKDKNAISLLLFGKINLKKVKLEKGEFGNKCLAFTLANMMLKDGIPAALSYYKACKDSTNMYLTEHQMNYAGYLLFQAGKTKEAAAMFKINTQLSGASFNAFDSYAEALLALGDKTHAIENFKESVKLNPGSKNGLKRLKELGVNTDDLVKKYNVAIEALKLLEGDYLSTNDHNWIRWIKFVVEDGVLVGNDNGYRYKLLPVGEGKFINPDDGASLVFDTRDKNAINLLLFGEITLKKVKRSIGPTIADLKKYAGVYLPAKKDTLFKEMEIRNSGNKLFRFIKEAEGTNKNVELEFVTDNLFFYTDRSMRSIDFIVNDKKEVTGCIVRRYDGIFNFSKKR